MKKMFPSFHRWSSDDIQSIWNKAIFVFDTNVLLNTYRYPEGVATELLNTIRLFGERIWIPHKVALEFQRNRLSVIAEQRKKIYAVQKLITNNLDQLIKEINTLDIDRRHSFLEPDVLIEIFEQSRVNSLKKVDEFSEKQIDVHDDDVIRSRIESIFDGKVGDPVPNQQQLDALYKDALNRFEKTHPPGFEDYKKANTDESTFVFNGIEYRSEFGDYLVWRQILNYAQAQKIENIVFVTDDNKDDWWWKVKSGGPKTIGPRRELVEEFAETTGSHAFLMYSSESFLKFAREESGANVSDSSIKILEDYRKRERKLRDHIAITREPALGERIRFDREAEMAVAYFLSLRYPDSEILYQSNYPDIVVREKTSGLSMAVEVKSIWKNTTYSDVESSAQRMNAFAHTSSFDKYFVFLVQEQPTDMSEFIQTFFLDGRITLFTGYINGSGEFVEVQQFN